MRDLEMKRKKHLLDSNEKDLNIPFIKKKLFSWKF